MLELSSSTNLHDLIILHRNQSQIGSSPRYVGSGYEVSGAGGSIAQGMPWEMRPCGTEAVDYPELRLP